MARAYYPLSFGGSFSNVDVHQGVSFPNLRPLPQRSMNEKGKQWPTPKGRQKQASLRHGRMSLWSSMAVSAPNLTRQGSLWVC